MEHRTQQPARLQPATRLRQSASAVSELRLQAPVFSICWVTVAIRKRSSPITCQPFSIPAKNSKPPLTCFQALRRGPNDVIVKPRRDSPGLHQDGFGILYIWTVQNRQQGSVSQL